MKTNTRANNMVIAQSGGPSMVINQSLVGAVLAARASKKVGRILGARHGIAGILGGDYVDLRKPTNAQLEIVARTPSSALGSVRRKPTPEDCEAIFAELKKRGVKYFFYIGGNDSAETVKIIADLAAREGRDLVCYHIPKTIDDDLRNNDHTPGYGSAAKFVAMALQGDDLDNRAMGGVKIDVIMGRDAGFLTAAAALGRTSPSDGPHLVYFPERPFCLKGFARDVEAAMKKFGRCVVAVSEGIRDAKGVPVAAAFSTEKDSHGNAQLSGTGALGDMLAKFLKAETGIKRVRADTFGYLQRSFPGIASPVDAREARGAGAMAVKCATAGRQASGTITIQRKPGRKYVSFFAWHPLADVARDARSLPDAYIAKNGHDVTKAYLAYALPLVGPLPPKATFV